MQNNLSTFGRKGIKLLSQSVSKYIVPFATKRITTIHQTALTKGEYYGLIIFSLYAVSNTTRL